MKTQRHAAILKIVRSDKVASQEQLRERLKAEGFDVTQATLSRDIRDLGLAKVAAPTGLALRTAARERPRDSSPPGTGSSPRCWCPLDGVGRCSSSRHPRGARRRWPWRSTAPGWEEIIGTIAGDDAILVIHRSERARRAVQTRLKELAGLPD